MQLILASASPQRRTILERLGVAFEVRATGVEEIEQGDAAEVALANARSKARAAQRAGDAHPVLACDTVVSLDGVLYGKPADAAGARATLARLGGATHEVVSALVLIEHEHERERSAVARTLVSFRELTAELLDWYIARGEWRGRAGGYAIQGAGAALVRSLRGDYENVVGLPVSALLDLCPHLLHAPD